MSNFQENKTSFCKRILADTSQIIHETNVILFTNGSREIKFQLDKIEEYLGKIKDHLVNLERLNG